VKKSNKSISKPRNGVRLSHGSVHQLQFSLILRYHKLVPPHLTFNAYVLFYNRGVLFLFQGWKCSVANKMWETTAYFITFPLLRDLTRIFVLARYAHDWTLRFNTCIFYCEITRDALGHTHAVTLHLQNMQRLHGNLIRL
jgi:hypothetical protein